MSLSVSHMSRFRPGLTLPSLPETRKNRGFAAVLASERLTSVAQTRSHRELRLQVQMKLVLHFVT